jgi:hypothetical protein
MQYLRFFPFWLCTSRLYMQSSNFSLVFSGQKIDTHSFVFMLSLRHDQTLRLSLFTFTSLTPTTGNFTYDAFYKHFHTVNVKYHTDQSQYVLSVGANFRCNHNHSFINRTMDNGSDIKLQPVCVHANQRSLSRNKSWRHLPSSF